MKKIKKINSLSFIFNNFSYNKIISLSLLLTSFYYFHIHRSFFFYIHKLIAIQILTLFLFSIVFFFVISKIFKILESKINDKIYSLIIYLFFAWLLVQSVKAFFFLANYITLPNLVSKLFILPNEYAFHVKVITFFIPYILSLIIIFFYRNQLSKFLHFFVVLGYVFFALVIYETTYILFSLDTKSSVKSNIESKQPKKIQTNRKVLWIVFDEFDPQIAFENNKNNELMQNFNKLKKNSLTHLKMYSPAKDTIDAMPAHLIGMETKGTFVNTSNGFVIVKDILMLDNKILFSFTKEQTNLFLKSKDDELIKFSYKSTIFSHLSELGFKSAIMSSVFPYCSKISSEKFEKCIGNIFDSTKPHEGILFVFSFFSKIERFFNYLNKNKKNTETLNIKANINTKTTINIKKIKDVDGYNTVFYSDIENCLNSNVNLTFVHLNLPHLPAKFAQKIFDIKVYEGMPSYILNLKMSDLVLEKIINILNKYNNEEIMLILSSDHWLREKDNNPKNIYPILFISKIFNDNSKIEISKPGSAIYIQELILKFLTEEIVTHSDIKFFLEKKPFHKTYVSKY